MIISIMIITGLTMPGATASSRTDQSALVRFGDDVPPVLRFVTPIARRFFHVCVAMVADSLAEADLTPLEYGVLAYLSETYGEPGIDQISLAGRLGVDRNNASLLIDKMEARRLVERRVRSEVRR